MIVLKEEEKKLIEQICSYLDATYREGSKQITEQFANLEKLGDAISQYPLAHSISLSHGEEQRLVDMLINTAFTSQRLFIPPYAVCANSFLITKLHSFFMLTVMVQEEVFLSHLRQNMFSIVCILMAEEVYLSCLRNTSFPADAKFLLAKDLIALWDSISEPKGVHYFPTLQYLWEARDRTPPTFGTMNGTSEIIQLFTEMPQKCSDFLKEHTDDIETKWALDEFIFGLSYEDLKKIRDRMAKAEISAVNKEGFDRHFGDMPFIYTAIKDNDPRTFYNFFIERRNQAEFRRQISAEGPKKTLEEMYLEYLTSPK